MVRLHRSATATVLESASGYCEKARLDLVGRFEIEMVAGKTQPVLIIHRLARLDAEQQLVGLMFFPQEVMAVIGGDDGDIIMTGQIDETLIDGLLFRNAVVLKLEIEPVAEDGQIFIDKGIDVCFVIFEDRVGYFPFETGGEADEPFIVLSEYLFVDPGHVVEAFGVGEADEFQEVLVALLVHGEEHHMVGIVLALHFLLVEARFRRQIGFTADDGFQTGFLRVKMEVHGAEHVPVIGYGAGLHAEGLGETEEPVVTDSAVEEAELRVDMEMNEIYHGSTHSHSMVLGGFDEMS